MLRAGDGEHQLQNSKWVVNTCHDDSLHHGRTCISTAMEDNEAIPGQWQTVDNNLTVSFHHDTAHVKLSARWSYLKIIKMPTLKVHFGDSCVLYKETGERF